MAALRSPARPCSDARASWQLPQAVIDQVDQALLEPGLDCDPARLFERLARFVVRAPVLQQVVTAQKQVANSLRRVGVGHQSIGMSSTLGSRAGRSSRSRYQSISARSVIRI